MKKLLKVLSAIFLGLFGVTAASCNVIPNTKTETPIVNPSEEPEESPEKTPEETPEKTPEETPEKTPEGIDLSKYDLITIERAIEIAQANGEDKNDDRYYIYGTVKSIDNASYGQMTITDGTHELMVYGTYDKDGGKRYSELDEKPVAGDAIVLYGNLCTYKGTPEVYSGWIQEFMAQPKPEVTLPAAGSEITIAQAIAIAEAAGDTATVDRWIIKATVKSVVNPTYGEMYITDGTNELYVYGTYDKDGVKRYSELTERPVAGDSITLSVNLSVFNGTPQVKAGWIQEFTHNAPSINPADYTVSTLTDAREAAKGAKVKVTGVVASITNANGYVPDGVIIVDGDSSIYVYGRDVAGQVAVGNKITVCGEKDYFIAENETTFATLHGYAGACQLTNTFLMENDKKTNVIDLSFAEEMTVKQLMDTSFGDNVTSLVVKSTAIIHKDEQKGYTNYYINDLDGVTGSYVYTKCNGGDFTWLDEFDGQICTVYFTALNAKSTDVGCIWRLQPVKVEKIANYQFDDAKAPHFAIEYYALDQIKAKYTTDPELELITSAEIASVNVSGITLAYTSNNTDVVSFVETNGKLVMHTKEVGTAEVTITATYGSHVATKIITITVEEPVSYQTITVKQAIDAAKGTEVTLKGIVTNGQQNKPAVFFLTDETGIIAVEFASAVNMAEIKVGHEVIIKGTRSFSTNSGNDTPQVVIVSAELLVNNYGSHEHPSSVFNEVALADLLAISKSTDVNTYTGYTATGKIVKAGNNFYTNYYFGTDSDNLLFYAGSGDQYAWILDQYVGQEITIDLVFVNWNGKGFRITLVAIHTADGKVINNFNLK